MRHVSLAMFGGSFTDNGTNLNGDVSQNANGSISIPLVGSKAGTYLQPNPADVAAVYAAWPITTAVGRLLNTDSTYGLVFRLDFPGGAPVVGDNVSVGLAFVDATIASGTFNGVARAIEFHNATGNPRSKGTIYAAGVASTTNGAAAASVAGMHGAFLQRKGGTGTHLITPENRLSTIDSSGNYVNSSRWDPATLPACLTTQKYLVLFAMRSLATDTDAIVIAPRVTITPSMPMDA